MAIEQNEEKAVQSYEAEVMDKIRSIHGTATEIKQALAETHRLTKEIHERVMKK